MKLSDIKPIHVVNFIDDLKKDGRRLDGKEGKLSDPTIILVSFLAKKATKNKSCPNSAPYPKNKGLLFCLIFNGQIKNPLIYKGLSVM
jgi:hypothetical protein